jgi:ribosomal protein S1
VNFKMDMKSPGMNTQVARSVSIKQLESWSLKGEAHKQALNKVVKEIIISLNKSSSPFKTMNAAMKKLQALFNEKEVRGHVELHNNRHITFRLAFPTNDNEGLYYCLLYGEINARSKAVTFDLTTPLHISIHALRRIIERLEVQSESLIIDEIYSCIGQVIHWHQGAKEIHAKCWPIMSNNGFFIGTSKENSLTTTAVTWIKAGWISKKWGLPLYNLSRLKQFKPSRLEDALFAKEFLQSFPWMLHEHVPGEDTIANEWEDSDEHSNQENEYEIEDLNSAEHDGLTKRSPKLSIAYISGLNYQNDTPPFQTNTLFNGIVVQKRNTGSLIVGLKNGWVGIVPWQSINRGKQLITGYKAPEIGDEIEVVISKISHFADESAHHISLDTKDVSEATWEQVKRTNPIGELIEGNIIFRQGDVYAVSLRNGVRGIIPTQEIKDYLKNPIFLGSSPIGIELNFEVIGYETTNKKVNLTIQKLIDAQLNLLKEIPYRVGDELNGMCIKNGPNYRLIQLENGLSGLLHSFNNWGNVVEDIGTNIKVVIIEIDRENSEIYLAKKLLDTKIEKFYYAKPATIERWQDFINKNSVGNTLEVQVIYYKEHSLSYLVVTSMGIVGKLPLSEINWNYPVNTEGANKLIAGDFINVKILRINLEKNKVVFSKKLLDEHPAFEELSKLHSEKAISGEVVSVVDYGYFIKLEPYAIQGLLHQSQVPAGSKFIKNERVSVFLNSIDKKNNRVTLSLTAKYSESKI